MPRQNSLDDVNYLAAAEPWPTSLVAAAFTRESMGYPVPSPPRSGPSNHERVGDIALTTFTAETPPKPTTFTRLRAGIAGAMLAEFFGTFVLLLLGLGTCAVNVVGLSGSGRQTVPFGRPTG